MQSKSKKLFESKGTSNWGNKSFRDSGGQRRFEEFKGVYAELNVSHKDSEKTAKVGDFKTWQDVLDFFGVKDAINFRSFFLSDGKKSCRIQRPFPLGKIFANG